MLVSFTAVRVPTSCNRYVLHLQAYALAQTNRLRLDRPRFEHKKLMPRKTHRANTESERTWFIGIRCFSISEILTVYCRALWAEKLLKNQVFQFVGELRAAADFENCIFTIFEETPSCKTNSFGEIGGSTVC